MEDDMNEWRASAAEEALEAFVEVAGGDLEVEREDMLGDLLCDIGHLCDRHGIDYAKLIERAKANYEWERTHPDD